MGWNTSGGWLGEGKAGVELKGGIEGKMFTVPWVSNQPGVSQPVGWQEIY